MKKKPYQVLFPWKHHFFLFVTLLCFNYSYSQSGRGIIKGNVSDASGPLLGASVMVSGSSIGAKSDRNGDYTISVDPGTYTIIASYIGYDRSVHSNIKVNTLAPTVLNIK